LTLLTDLTPGTAARVAVSSRRIASRLRSGCRLLTLIWTSSSSAMPLSRRISVVRLPITKIALQMIAQLRAISSTISAAAVLCRMRIERIGRISMGISGSEE